MVEDYNQIYKTKDVWGDSPNKLLERIIDKLDKGGEALDLGCGQGRDAIFLAEKGFLTTAIDKSEQAIRDFNFHDFVTAGKINLVLDDINNFNIEKNKYKIINIFNVLNFLTKEEGLKIIKNIKNGVVDGGCVIISALMIGDPMFLNSINSNNCFFAPSELKELFSDFDINYYLEEVVDDHGHPGNKLPHKHEVVRLIAFKIT